MKQLLGLAAILEVGTALVLLIVPSLIAVWLLNTELTGLDAPVAGVLGIAVISLGLAYWPATPLVGLLTYSGAATLYLAYFGFAEGMEGVLLWPMVVLHAVITLGCVAILFRKPPEHREM